MKNDTPPPYAITRNAIVTLDDGAKERIKVIVPTSKVLIHPEEFERKFITEFNRSQPNLLHKLVGIKIMRN